MIPQIYTITEGEAYNDVISQFASKYAVESSHIVMLNPEKDELTVEQIHLMQKDIKVAFSKRVLMVLRGVDDSGLEVQNSLLKCLEEDSERILFLFLVKNSARLLSTILSRCSIIEPKQVAPRAESVGSYKELFSFQKNSDVKKDEAVERLDRYIQYSSLKSHYVLSHLLKVRKLIIDNNMNPILALDNILIFLSKASTMNITHGK